MSEHNGSYASHGHMTSLEPVETANVETNETGDTVETTIMAPAPTSADSSVGLNEKKATQAPAPAQAPASTVQVTITLDAETHKHFADLAAADDRSLNKYLARELRAAYISSRLASVK